jgi:ATP-dependent Lon protease
VETIATPTALSESGGNVHLMTGQLGNVMKESVNIAYTYARSFLSTRYMPLLTAYLTFAMFILNQSYRDAANNFFKCHQVHLHCPEGAVEKDGPSAGVAMAVAFGM